MREVAVVGVGYTGFKSITPEMSYKEIMFEARIFWVLFYGSLIS